MLEVGEVLVRWIKSHKAFVKSSRTARVPATCRAVQTLLVVFFSLHPLPLSTFYNSRIWPNFGTKSNSM